MKQAFYLGRLTACAFLLLGATSCEKELEKELRERFGNPPRSNPSNSTATTFYALAGGVRLDAYSTQHPETSLGSVSITGLQAGETILAIDFRPATGQLYGVGSTSRLYVINPQSGAARAIGSGPFTPALTGKLAGFDFNPTVDRIRLVTDAGQNLRLNPETGLVAAVDGAINGAPGAMLAGAAYTNNVAGATTTTLYDIDVAAQMLYKQTPPNDGTLVPVGSLKLRITGEGGFDIAPTGDVALGMFEVNKKSTLFSIDLATGDTRVVAKYDKDLMYTGLAIPTQPVAYSVGADNSLLIFNPQNPAANGVSKPLMGLQSGETILGIDFRPANGQLYALGSTSRLYTLNTSSGAATAVGTLSTPLSGTAFGFDFNPTVDRIRIVSNTGQNLRVNPADGAALVDGPLNPGAPAVTAAAYTNNFAGTTSTALFDIDSNTDKLYRQDPPNAGTLVEIGNLGLDVEAANGFDIGGTSNVPYALLTVNGTTRLFRINTTTGAATPIGNLNGSANGLAVGLGF
ncbi:DUF4394 domain-containing protein [Solirubrum puertoriconensis]|uniref:DUF4394 domain-containing protein n=1 Tax=Solirubrum puertoriconensis TaxID=1751427 RepID=A0A9X0HNT8_SOLP1|nr:DUF4394 domain-containing protein [Solirubrum puertoriconensis]KUG09343.1 hypothetical protein ASU33_16545 [Solirubrum puertoriconensis]